MFFCCVSYYKWVLISYSNTRCGCLRQNGHILTVLFVHVSGLLCQPYTNVTAETQVDAGPSVNAGAAAAGKNAWDKWHPRGRQQSPPRYPGHCPTARASPSAPGGLAERLIISSRVWRSGHGQRGFACDQLWIIHQLPCTVCVRISIAGLFVKCQIYCWTWIITHPSPTYV